MESNAENGKCACGSGPTLAVLSDVQRAYEDRMELISQSAGSNKLQKQVQLFKSWVGDLVAQNTLLARTVEDLEIDLTTRLLSERRKYTEMVSELRVEVTSLRRRLARKDSDLRGLLEVLRRLREFDYCAIDSIHFNEVTESDIFGPVAWNPTMDQGDSNKTKLKGKNKIYKFHNKDNNKKICDQVNELRITIDALQMENFSKEREIRRLSKDVQQYEQTIMGLKNDVSSAKYHTPDVSKKDAYVMAEICCAGTKECGDVEPVKEYGANHHTESRQYQERIQNMESSGDNVRALREMNVSLTEEVQAMHRVCAAISEQHRVAALRAQFKDEIIREMRRQLRQAKAKVGRLTSTPNESVTHQRRTLAEDTDISVVERPASPPLLITDDSISEPEPRASVAREASVRSLAQVIATRTATARLGSIYNDTSRKNRENGPCDCCTLQGSTGASSIAESASEVERARCLEDKLHATLQILKNKEETVRVQAESLALAEERISSLASRAPCVAKFHQDIKIQPMRRSSANGCKTEMTDVSVTAETQDTDEKIVNTLRDNLSVIEELYRECFYESAKQEQLIEMLRRSYLDVRAGAKHHSERLGLKRTADLQHAEMQNYQDLAVEVENLKTDISNFLNNSNNDSGVWERGEEAAAPVSDDLNHIVAQLHRLKDMLTGECTCGLQEENQTLRRKNEINEVQISELQQRVSDLEGALGNKDNVDQQYQRQIQEKELELKGIRQQIYNLDKSSKEDVYCDRLTSQLKETQGLLDMKTSDLVQMQQKCDQQEATIKGLRDKLVNADVIMKEKVDRLSCEVWGWRQQLQDSRRRLQTLQAELHRARLHCRQLQHHYTEKTDFTYKLQAQLEEAQTRGAALCDEARHVMCDVKRCLRKQRQRQKDQEEKIKQQETLIRTLQSSQTESELMNEPCCSKFIDIRYNSASERDSSHLGSDRMSANEMHSNGSPPTPPRRLLRKKPLREETSYSCSVRHASASRTKRSDERASGCGVGCPREVLSPDELLERVECAHEALAHAHRRWCAPTHAHRRAHTAGSTHD